MDLWNAPADEDLQTVRCAAVAFMIKVRNHHLGGTEEAVEGADDADDHVCELCNCPIGWMRPKLTVVNPTTSKRYHKLCLMFALQSGEATVEKLGKFLHFIRNEVRARPHIRSRYNVQISHLSCIYVACIVHTQTCHICHRPNPTSQCMGAKRPSRPCDKCMSLPSIASIYPFVFRTL
jgi:hypothetical protein